MGLIIHSLIRKKKIKLIRILESIDGQINNTNLLSKNIMKHWRKILKLIVLDQTKMNQFMMIDLIQNPLSLDLLGGNHHKNLNYYSSKLVKKLNKK